MGDLLRLYGVGDIAYIGGGFDKGVHSITEAAGHGLALACGINCGNSSDSKALLFINVLTVVEDSTALYR